MVETSASEEEALQGLVEDSIEREDRRKLGMYVDVWEEDSGKFTVASPVDILEVQATKANVEIERTHEILGILVTILESNEQLMKYFVGNFKERIVSNR